MGGWAGMGAVRHDAPAAAQGSRVGHGGLAEWERGEQRGERD